jgi:hypothetical protein
MSCSIPYLQNFQKAENDKNPGSISDSKIKQLEEIDIDIKSQLSASGLFTVTNKKNNQGQLLKLMLLSANDDRQKEQLELIVEINKFYNADKTNPKSAIYVKDVDINKDGKLTKNVVIVDVRVLENANLQNAKINDIDEITSELRESDFIQVLQDALSPPFVSKATNLDDYVTNTEQIEFLNGVLDTLSKKVGKFQSNFTDYGNAVKLQFSESTYKNLNYLKILAEQIKNDESIDKIADLSTLIVKSNHILNYIYRRFSGNGSIGMKERIEKLNEITDKDEFLNQQKYIGEFFAELRELQHIFNFFSEFYINSNKDKTGWEDRNLYNYERGLSDLLLEVYPNYTFKERKEWLTNIFVGNYDVVVETFKEKLKNENATIEDLDNKLNKIYEKSQSTSKSIVATLEETHNKINKMRQDSMELQKEYLATIIDRQSKEIYTPEKIWESDMTVSGYRTDAIILQTMKKAGLSTDLLQIKNEVRLSDNFFTHFLKVLEARNVPEDVRLKIEQRMNENKKNDNRAMFYADKNKIKSLLTLAAKDIDITDRFFEYGTQFDDYVLRMATVLVTKQLMIGEIENKNSLIEANKNLVKLGLSIKDPKRKAIEDKFQQEILYLEDEDKLEVAQNNDLFIEVDGIKKGEKIRYKARVGRALVIENNKAEYEVMQKAFYNNLSQRVDEVFKLIQEDKIKDVYDINYTDDLKINYVGKNGNIYLSNQFNIKYNSESKIKENIKKGLIRKFKNTHLKTIDNALERMVSKTIEFEKMAELLNKREKGHSYFKRNTYEREFKEGMFLEALNNKTIDFNETVLSGSIMLVKVKTGDDIKYEYVDISEPDLGLNPDEEVVSIFNYSNEFKIPVKENLIWKALKSELDKDSNMKEYYNYSLEKFKQINKNLGAEYIKHGLIKVPKTTDKSLKQRLLSAGTKVTDYIEGFKFKEPHTQPIMVKNDDGVPVRGDANGRILEDDEETQYKIKKLLSGEINKRIKPTFTNAIPYDETEDDLFLALHLLDASSTSYNKKKELEPIMLTLQTFFKGDEQIGINQRKAYVKLFNDTTLQGTKGNPDTIPAERSAKALEHFINNFLYGLGTKDYNVGGTSVKQITDSLKGLANFQVLAGNHIAAVSNLLTGQTNKFLLAQGKKYGLSEKIMIDSDKEYWGNVFNGNFAKDAVSTVFDQSLISQLVWFFDAIAGDMVDLKGQIIPKTLKDRIGYDTLFFSTAMAEHVNQVPLMLAILRGYIMPSGVSFKDILTKNDNELFEVDWIKGGVDPNDQATIKKIYTEIKGKIEIANTSANGQYGKYSKNELQHNSLFSMGLVFSNWIYASLKTRYGKQDMVTLAGEFIDDGYQRQFIRNIFSTFNEALDEVKLGIKKDNSLQGYIKAIVNEKGIKGLSYGLFEVIAKQAGFVADRVTFSSLSKNSEKFNEWLYGKTINDDYESKRIALIRASSELTFFVGAVLMGLFLKALNDDDDEESQSEILKALELFTARYTNDTGQFLFASSPSSSRDYIARKVKDPFALTRQFDTNTGLLSQLFGWDVNYDDGFDFNLKFDDRYAKSGAGYEKGDLKIKRKLMKSVFSPLYQIYRFGDLNEQLKYTKLLNKSSSPNQTKVSEEELEQFAENREE